ncbi:high affinity immunoglobulin gamma Fc receptor I-like [Astatotilapia calliptera]|uniref:high affinity immunoglobulin gamma Fc receptor I-like n=1 Tax=Astatotilapia calliptera TaxID=8154 RepID=UPI000E406108|nr:high affinity immunoglobulin gamma Fc receptor I-like [Astatotilapia calliptera]
MKNSADFEYVWFREPSFNSEKTTVAGESKRELVTSDAGIYNCRGRIKGTNSGPEESNSVTIQETVSNRTDVTLQHSWSQIFTGETITLRCEIQGGEGKVWKYEWTAPNTNSPPTSSEYRISSVSVSHSGDYRCRGSSDYLLTGWSDAFRLTASYKPRTTLTAGTTIIPVGGSVTLTCSVQSSDGWKYEWFRDNTTVDVVPTSNGQINVSQEGLYRCRGGRGNPVYYTEDSQEIQINTTEFSSPVWLIVGLVCGVSLIIILLLLLYLCRQSKYSCFTRSIQSESHSPGSSTNHGVNQDETHEHNSLHPGDANLYESITPVEDTGTGTDEPGDVTYSLITLQNFGKKKKHHKAEQSAVYSEVKTGAAEDSLMYAEVKQPKKEKAKKNKGTSSPAADAAVYSEVTSGSSLSQ